MHLKITDNGIGFDVSQKNEVGNGLQHMKNRVLELDGNFVIESGAGTGTSLLARVPLKSL